MEGISGDERQSSDGHCREGTALLMPRDEAPRNDGSDYEQASPGVSPIDEEGSLHSTRTRPSISFAQLESGSVDIQSTQKLVEKKPPQRTSTIRKFQHVAWMSEFAACFFSFACIGAVVGVLCYEDGKELDHWSLAIPPNAVVAFIATLAKSSCLMAITEVISQLKWRHYENRPQALLDFELFDSASRGPFGSMLLLCQKHNHTILASSAALLTLIALLFDPFVQLAIRFPSKPFVMSTISAGFRTAYAFDPQSSYITAHYLRSTASAIAPGMQSAIVMGLYASQLDPAFTCPTGNCTFPAVSSLGICSTCSNITAKYVSSCATHLGDFHCQYTMPSGNNLTTRWIEHGATGDYAVTIWNASTTIDTSSDASSGRIISIETIQMSTPADINTLPEPIAWKCDLDFCIQDFVDILVSNGNLTFNVSSSHTMQLTNESLETSKEGGMKPMNKYTQTYSNASQATSYLINSLDLANAGAYLAESFSVGMYNDGQVTRRVLKTSGGADVVAPPIPQEMASTDDLPEAMAYLAASMTEFMRTGPNSTEVPGESHVWKSYIRVRWVWLSLPVAVVALAVVLLGIVACSTHTRIWKSSAIAALVHGVVPWEDCIEDRAELEDVARLKFVVLQEESCTFVVTQEK